MFGAGDEFRNASPGLRKPDDAPDVDRRLGFDARCHEDIEHLHVKAPREDALGARPNGEQNERALTLFRRQNSIGWRFRLGRFFDRNGQPVETDLGRRTLSVGLDDIRRGRTVAVAGGAVKVDAIRAVLASGHLQGLITDERTAAKIIEAAGPIPAGGSAGRLDKAR